MALYSNHQTGRTQMTTTITIIVTGIILGYALFALVEAMAAYRRNGA